MRFLVASAKHWHFVAYQIANYARICTDSCAHFFGHQGKGFIVVLNPIITHSPRFAAMATNRPYGQDIDRNPAILHRMALRQAKRLKSAGQPASAQAESLREQTA